MHYVLLLCYFRVVKQSSYRLNSLILVAVFIGFVGTLLHVIKLDSDMSELFTTTVCNVRVHNKGNIQINVVITFTIQVRVWAYKLAFVVSFGALFVKVWRLYRIFFNKAMAQRVRYSVICCTYDNYSCVF